MNNLLKVRIISPKEVIFEGEAVAVSSINSLGKFDILASHANFLTLINNQPITVLKADNSQTEFRFPLAVILTSGNKVNVYTNIQIQKTLQ